MIATLALMLVLQEQPAKVQAFQVRHEHAVGSCTGTLTFSATDVRYETKEKKHQRTWSYPDVKFFEIISRGELKIHSYEAEGILRLRSDREYTFKASEWQFPKELSEFLVAKSPRAVVTGVILPGAVTVQEIPVRHRHSLGGCQGVLTIAQDRIIYRAENNGDSRVWLLKDLESFASNDPSHLRLSTAFETFNFDLKLPLQEGTYEHIWKAVNSLDIQTYSKARPQ